MDRKGEGRVIYFIQPEPGGPIKIGYTRTEESVKGRIADIQTGCPWPLRVLGVIEGDYNREAGFHAMFARYRTQGEWFSPQDTFLDWLHDHGMDPRAPLSFERLPNLELVS